MVEESLDLIYLKLFGRHDLYKKAVRNADIIIKIGALTLFLGLTSIFPIILEKYRIIDFGISFPFLILFGILLIIIGSKVKNRKPKPPELLITEKQFLKIYDALLSLDTYIRDGDDFSKNEAVKILIKIENDLTEPDLSSYELWNELTKDSSRDMILFKRNFKERIIPAINKGSKESINLAYSIIKEFSRFLLNPNNLKLKDLNENISNIPLIVGKKEPKIKLFRDRPRIKHIILIIIFILPGLMTFYLGSKILNLSNDICFPLACMIWATLTAGYMSISFRGINV